MRLSEASKARRSTPPIIGDHQVERYSLKDYGTAAACAALLIAPAPFFWAPPLWVMVLLAAPGSRRPGAVDGGRTAWPAALNALPLLLANDNRPPMPDEVEVGDRRAA